MKFRSLIASLALVVSMNGLAHAQSMSGGPTAGATTPPNAPGAPMPLAIDRDTDLPIDKPDLATPPKPPTPPEPPQDPKDTEKPPTFYGHDITSKSQTIFYVIDISGSMGWDEGTYINADGNQASGNRLDRAKAELIKSVLSLPQNFKFNMLSYDCDVYQWQSDMQPADDQHKASATGWVNGLQPQGATGTGPAVSSALQLRDNKLVVLLTDGGPNCGAGNGEGGRACREAHRQMIRENNTQDATINVFGISATGNMKEFCMNVASDNHGSYTDVR